MILGGGLGGRIFGGGGGGGRFSRSNPLLSETPSGLPPESGTGFET